MHVWAPIADIPESRRFVDLEFLFVLHSGVAHGTHSRHCHGRRGRSVVVAAALGMKPGDAIDLFWAARPGL